MAVDKTYTIEDVWIVLAYKDDSEENFKLEAPNGDNAFEFGFRKIPKLEDYRDANMKWQRGCYYYQLFVRYQYQSHEMDLRKLLVAENIALKFPPAFGQQENYNQADCLLANESVVKNYLAGLAMGGDSGEVVPSGDVTLEFEGIDAFTEAQLFESFGWNQSDNADPDDEGEGEDPEITEDIEGADVFVVAGGGAGGHPFKTGTGITAGGGGGAGGVLFRKNVTLEAGVIDYTVGTGGKYPMDEQGNKIITPRVAEKGEDSILNQFIAIGGGLGSETSTPIAENSGGSGGGAYKASNFSGGAGGPGVANQGTDGGTSSTAVNQYSGNGGGVQGAYDEFFNPSDDADPTDPSTKDGIDFSSVFGSYFQSNYGSGGWFGSGGGRYISTSDTDGELETVTPGAGLGLISTASNISRFPTDAVNGTGSGGGAGGNNGEGIAEPGGNGGDGFVMFRVPIEDASKVLGSFADSFDYDGYRHYVLSGSTDEPPPTPPPDPEVYEGSVQVTSGADANFTGTAPETYILIRNSPSTASDECGTGGTEFNIEYKLTDYCTVLPVISPSLLSVMIAQFIDANIPGLNAYNGTGYDGAPAVFMQSETLGLDDEGEGIIFGVPSVLEQDGPVFNRYTVYLSGAEEASSIDEPINIRLGKTIFATTDNITGSESKESIAQKIYDACVAVDQDDIEFTKSGETITVTATGFRLAISLDIGGTGFDYIITQMTLKE